MSIFSSLDSKKKRLLTAYFHSVVYILPVQPLHVIHDDLLMKRFLLFQQLCWMFCPDAIFLPEGSLEHQVFLAYFNEIIYLLLAGCKKKNEATPL